MAERGEGRQAPHRHRHVLPQTARRRRSPSRAGLAKSESPTRSDNALAPVRRTG
jgi:hypothetical protein